jgi:hypothetical protein
MQSYDGFWLIPSFFVFFFLSCLANDLSFGQNGEKGEKVGQKRGKYGEKQFCSIII